MKSKGKSLNSLLEFDYSYSNSFKNHYLVGIDEVGRGAFAGPVIACAFSWGKIFDKKTLDNNLEIENLNDSKQISKEKREHLYKTLTVSGFYGLGYASILEIEKLNILNATFLAMKRAFESLSERIGEVGFEPYLLVDGNKFNPYINCRQSFVIDGDAKSSLIASASIIAKVYRDQLMFRLSKVKKFKKYKWEKNAGYGTAIHRQAIKKSGISPLHRKLFVRKTMIEV